jgi:hypothetical protein
MSTKDEVILRTPDALLNGQGMVDVIQSCCPAITDAWKTPSVDVDAILIAIRIATYGNEMNFDSKCAHCGEENNHGVDLATTLSEIQCPNYNIIEYKDLKFKLKPQHYFDSNNANKVQFEEQRLVNLLNDSVMVPEDKARMLTDSMNKLTSLGISAVVNSTEYIELPDGQRINDIAFITELYERSESQLVKLLQAQLKVYADESKVKPVTLSCAECEKPYRVELTFDYASFFGKGF